MKFLFTILTVFISFSLFAHKVVVFAYVAGDTVMTESKYPGGVIIKDGSIKIFTSEGKLLLTGKTDEKGKFSFKIPKQAILEKTGLKIELYTGEGHKAFWPLKSWEIADSTKKSEKNIASIKVRSENTSSRLGDVLMGLTAIAMIFAVLYYIKRKIVK